MPSTGLRRGEGERERFIYPPRYILYEVKNMEEKELKQKSLKEIKVLLASGLRGAEYMTVIREYQRRIANED